MDVLSSQANIAGYKAVLLAANEYGRFMPMLMTAAGTVKAARVLVLGAGVAGLQAIATARRLGAVVEAFDVRPAVKEQVESLGARFVEVPSTDADKTPAETAGGYAREMSDAYRQRQAALIDERARANDIIITTALVPGRPAPVLLREETLKHMRPGSVIVDLAVEQGGNCPLTERDRVVVQAWREAGGLLQPAFPGGGRRQRAVRAQPARVSRRSSSTRPPASAASIGPTTSSAPRSSASTARPCAPGRRRSHDRRRRPRHHQRHRLRPGRVRRLPGRLERHPRAAHAAHERDQRHQLGDHRGRHYRDRRRDGGPAGLLGAIAVGLVAINTFGGFMVTHRMLAMFRKKDEARKK